MGPLLESRTKRYPKFVRDLNARIASIENAFMSRQLTGAVQRVETASVYGLDATPRSSGRESVAAEFGSTCSLCRIVRDLDVLPLRLSAI